MLHSMCADAATRAFPHFFCRNFHCTALSVHLSTNPSQCRLLSSSSCTAAGSSCQRLAMNPSGSGPAEVASQYALRNQEAAFVNRGRSVVDTSSPLSSGSPPLTSASTYSYSSSCEANLRRPLFGHQHQVGPVRFSSTRPNAYRASGTVESWVRIVFFPS